MKLLKLLFPCKGDSVILFLASELCFFFFLIEILQRLSGPKKKLRTVFSSVALKFGNTVTKQAQEMWTQSSEQSSGLRV